MRTKYQVLVAAGLAATVIAIVVRELSLPETDPMLVTEARLRADARRDMTETRSGVSDRVPFGLGLGHNPDSQGEIGSCPTPGEPDEDLSKLPLVQLMTILSGGDAGLSRSEEEDTLPPGSDPEGDWKFLQRTDSALRDSRLRLLAERFLSGNLGQHSDGD